MPIVKKHIISVEMAKLLCKYARSWGWGSDETQIALEFLRDHDGNIELRFSENSEVDMYASTLLQTTTPREVLRILREHRKP